MSIFSGLGYIFAGFDYVLTLVHNEPMDIQDWLSTLPGSPTPSQAADKAGVSKATLLRHVNKGQTTAEYVISIARAHGVNEIEALIDLEIVDANAVLELGIDKALDLATNRQLLAAIERRTDPEFQKSVGIRPGIINPDFRTLDDLAKRRHTTPETPPHVQDYPYDAVADSSPDEEEGDDHDYYA